ncbi:MAG: hypothetical protein KGL50_15895 [Burkholderiales bacterium]|nr:hypothetical protein [Burkholderiales bacterium]
MPTRRHLLLAAALVAACALATAQAQAPGPASTALRLAGRTELPGYQGDFDHLLADVPGGRLFVAGEDGASLEVFDLASGRHLRSVKGFGAPHALHLEAATRRLVVSDTGPGTSRVLDADTLAEVALPQPIPAGDSMAYDPSTGQLWLVTGGKNAVPKRPDTELLQIDARSLQLRGRLSIDSDFTEGIAFEQQGSRAFVNVAGRSEIRVVDKRTLRVLARWPVGAGRSNSPIALDEANQRLYVVTRQPFKLVEIDARSGAGIASFDVPDRTNQLLFDPAQRRLYATGDGCVAVFDIVGADRVVPRECVPSAPGAKTGLLVPALHRLYVAVSPGSSHGMAALLRYDLLPGP